MLEIGPYQLKSHLLLAPMAGISDLPFRNICRYFGAALTPSEMISADQRLWNTPKSYYRLQSEQQEKPRSIQIAGSDPIMLADAAQYCVERGADIIDINMGCPAKKVCKKAAGSALLRDEPLVERILKSVVQAVNVPVTLKIRTGWSATTRNALRIGNIAQASGVQALVIHGRTREDAYRGKAEYETIRQVKAQIKIPVIANGDIDSPEKAASVLKYTQADGLMIGRASRGQPWLFQSILSFLRKGKSAKIPTKQTRRLVVLQHIEAMHRFYPEGMAVRLARKHINAYLSPFVDYQIFRKRLMQTTSSKQQEALLKRFFDSTENN